MLSEREWEEQNNKQRNELRGIDGTDEKAIDNADQLRMDNNDQVRMDDNDRHMTNDTSINKFDNVGLDGSKIKEVKTKSWKEITYRRTFVSREHEGNKPHPCSHYDKSFSLKEILNQHILSVHKVKKPFKRTECNHSCSDKSKVMEHILENTNWLLNM